MHHWECVSLAPNVNISRQSERFEPRHLLHSGTEHTTSDLGDIGESDFTYWYRCYRTVLSWRVCLSVCLSLSCIVIKCQKIPTRFLLRTTEPHVSLPDRVNILLTSVKHFHPRLTQTEFERRIHSITNCGRMVTDSATVTMESLENHHRSSNGPSLRPPIRPFPRNGVSQMNRGPISRCVLSPGEYDRKYRQAVCCAGCHCVTEPSDVVFCKITLVLVWSSFALREQNHVYLSIEAICGPIGLKWHKCVYGWGSAPDPGGGAYNAPPDSLVGWGGDPSPDSLSRQRGASILAPLALVSAVTNSAVVIFGNISSLRE